MRTSVKNYLKFFFIVLLILLIKSMQTYALSNNRYEENIVIKDVHTMKPYFLIILGPPAVGKMTIGQEIAKNTGFKLFHNHLVVESLLPVFEFNSEHFKKLVKEFRTRIFEEVIIKRPNGIIFTFVTNFNDPICTNLLLQWINLFEKNNFEVCIVELTASLNTRLQRNETPNRLKHKASKRDLEFSRNILLQNQKEWLMEAPDDFFKNLSYFKINTENIAPQDVAHVIIKHFHLK